MGIGLLLLEVENRVGFFFIWLLNTDDHLVAQYTVGDFLSWFILILEFNSKMCQVHQV